MTKVKLCGLSRESSHPRWGAISGRGDKDCAAIARYRGEDLHE